MDLSMFELTGKVAIITGGARGIGKAIALGFAKAGADVAIADLLFDEAKATANEIERLGKKAVAISVDVRDINQVTNLVGKTLEFFGRIDILLNNAGGNVFAPVLKMGVDVWEEIIKENLSSVFICSKVVGEVMVKQRAGNIINMSSVAAFGPYLNCAHYAAAKAGIVSLTKTLAVEWAQYNIRVNAIAPGIIMTPLVSELARTSYFMG